MDTCTCGFLGEVFLPDLSLEKTLANMDWFDQDITYCLQEDDEHVERHYHVLQNIYDKLAIHAKHLGGDTREESKPESKPKGEVCPF